MSVFSIFCLNLKCEMVAWLKQVRGIVLEKPHCSRKTGNAGTHYRNGSALRKEMVGMPRRRRPTFAALTPLFRKRRFAPEIWDGSASSL
jgi:hypothetical protein